MVDKTINDIANLITDPAAADEFEGQRTGGGASFRSALADLHKALTKATQAEAEAGIDTEKVMTAERVAQAINALAVSVGDHGLLSGLLDDDHAGLYLKDILEDLTPQLGGDFDLNDKIASGGSVREVSETAAVTTHSVAGTFTPVLANGNEQIINVSANITLGKPITTGIPGTGSRKVRMVLELIQVTPGGHTMAFAGGFTALGNIPALNRLTTGDVTVVEIEYDTEIDDWRIIGDPVFDIDNQGTISGTVTPDFDDRTTPSMELMIQGDINGAVTMAAPINGPGTDEFGRLYFAIQANGTNDVTWNAVYDWGAAGAPDFTARADGETSLIVSIKAGTKWLTNLVKNDHGAVF